MTGDISYPHPTCHPYYKGRDLPNGWACIGEKDGYSIYAHFSNPDRPQWEHPHPADDAPYHALIDAEIIDRNFARDNFFRSSPTTIPTADAPDLECELAETKAALEAAAMRIETMKYQYDQLYSTFEDLKVYLMIINSSIL